MLNFSSQLDLASTESNSKSAALPCRPSGNSSRACPCVPADGSSGGKAGHLQVLHVLLPGPGHLVDGQPNSDSLLEIMVLSEGLGGKGGSSWRGGEFGTAD